MGRARKKLLSSVPWRDGEDTTEENPFADAKIKVTSEPGTTPTMHVPRKKSSDNDGDDIDDIIDPQLRFTFKRNYEFLQRVFSVDTVVKPLPPPIAYSLTRNLGFFSRIFFQFTNPEGIANAQKAVGLGPSEERDRSARY